MPVGTIFYQDFLSIGKINFGQLTKNYTFIKQTRIQLKNSDMIHLRKGLLTLTLIFVTALTYAQVSITVNVPTAGGFSAALIAAGGDANTVTNLTVTGNINTEDIQFMNVNMPALSVLDLEFAQTNIMPSNAFANKLILKSIKLPNNLEIIGSNAFDGCVNLEGSLSLPNALTIIGSYAFKDCSKLKGSLLFPNTITIIGSYAFWNCKELTGNIIIPNSINVIYDGVFCGCSGLSGDIVIPNSVKSIGNWSFGNCNGFNGVLSIPNSVTSIGFCAFYGCNGLIGNLIIPNSVTSIGSSAFSGCSGFTGSLDIPVSITKIEQSTFSNCSGFNGTLTIPNSVISIEENSFCFCSSFTGNLTIPNSVISIGRSAFLKCSNFKGSLNLSNSLTKIGEQAFYECSGFIGNLIIPNSAKSIEQYAFYNCSGFNGNLTLSNTLNVIGDYAFYGCSGFTGNLTIPNSVKTIGNYTFCYCTGFNGNLTLSNSLSTIGQWAFRDCINLVGGLSIPNSVFSIGTFCFGNCQSLNGELVLSNSLIMIGDNAFQNCKGLTGSIYIPNSMTALGNWIFDSCSSLNGNLSIPNSITTIGDGTFTGCSGLTGTLVIPESVKSIGMSAFNNCSNLSGDLIIPNSVKTIGGGAFSDCSGFTGNLIIPNSLTTISNFAFRKCDNLVGKLTIPNSITSIGFFSLDCAGLQKISANLVNPLVIDQSVFQRVNKTTCELIVPKGSKPAYQSASYWKDFVNISELIFVSFNSQGGTPVADLNPTYNSTITAPTAPTRTGYTFGGWYKEAACTNPWVFATDLITDNTTLFAKWTINVYTVTFNSQGGSTVASINTNYNNTITAPTTPTRTGYTFGGWYKEAAFTNAWIFASDVVTANTTLYAKWTINVYTLTFNSQGGSAVASVNTNYNTTITAPTAPTRTGYTFGGWYKEVACTNAWNFASDVVTANTTLYAKWTINVYTVTFNSQGGSAVANVNANYNTTIATPTAPTRTGYTFGGWYKEAACTNAWNFTTNTVITNTTLYAKWTINVYTVTFNSQSGSAVASVNANYNTTITTPTAPTRIGYTFGGWYKETACTNVWTFASDVVTTNTTLYAKWTINTYTVTFNSNGGTPVASVTAVHNAKISEPIPPTRTGYTFDGWYINLSDDFSFNFNMYMITSNLTLQAKWIPITYYVTFYSEGVGVNSRGAEYNTTVERPDDPVRTGHIFNGWYKEPTFITPWNFSTDKVTSNMSLYAKWTAITYTVTFNSQGGNSISSVVVNHGAKVTEPTPPIRNGYTFRGWYDQPNNGFIWFFDYSTVTKDMTLYAYWTINTYTITFDSKGGSAVASKTAEYNSTITAPLTPTRTGYTIAGWYKDEALTTIWDFNFDVVTDNAMLYAKWDINKYIVSFDSNEGNNVNYIEVNYNSTITRPVDPTRTGYTFAGWFKDQALTSEWNFSTDVVTSHMYLYAKWTINSYTVTFNTQGGSAITNVITNYNSTLTAPSTPTRTGYTFGGWYKEASCTNPWAFATDVVTSDITLYAKWAINTYTVTFNAQGGSAISNVTANYNSTITAPSAPTKTGYTFGGWYNEAGCINPWTFATDVVTSDITLYAKWNLSSDIETVSGNSIKLYPNPAISSLTIEGENIEEITIYSLIGAKVLQPAVTYNNDKLSFSIDVLESGIYFARIKTSENKIATIKFMKR